MSGNARAIAEQQLGELIDHADGYAYCRCPGAALHGSRTGKRDARVYYADGVPTIFCFHSNCAGAVGQANHALRSALGKLQLGLRQTGVKVIKPPEHSAREREKERATQLAATAQRALANILRDYPWSASQIWEDSPLRLTDDTRDDWRLLLSLFKSEDYLWIGDKRDSGAMRHRAYFRTAQMWLASGVCPKGPLICPAVLRPGCYSRSKANIERVPFLIIESDTLSKDQIGAVFHWLREKVGLHLRAVVDTGNRSLHGWLVRPDGEATRDLATVLPALRCDGAVLRPSQPVRLPGCWRVDTGMTQALLYFDPEDSP